MNLFWFLNGSFAALALLRPTQLAFFPHTFGTTENSNFSVLETSLMKLVKHTKEWGECYFYVKLTKVQLEYSSV